jgi:uncharacterized protein
MITFGFPGSTRRRLFLTLLLLFLVTGLSNGVSQAAGSISLTTLGSPYTQDFNTLATTGTANTVLPIGWDLNEAGSSTRNNGAYAASTGSDTAGDVYSFGASGSTERAYGTLFSSTLTPIIGAQFTNSTGSTVNALNVSYTGEMWRAGVTNRNAADRLDFQLSTNATSLTTGTWTDVDSLDFNSPNINATAGALNGNAAGNRTSIGFTITGLSIANGASFWIRWTDFDISPGADDGLAVDDFSLTPDTTVVTTNPTGVGAANPDPVTAGNSTLLTVAVTPGTNPTSTGLAVTGDLSTIGGSVVQLFFDDGTNGDVTAGDNVFSFLAAVPGATSAGAKSLPISITDAQARSGSTSILLTVQAAAATLVINEIDYDQPGTDTAEFVEIRNNDSITVNLNNYNIQMINGSGGGAVQYQLFNLPSVNLAPGDYFVLCGDAANVPSCDLDVTPNSDLIQNGAPDAVALRFGTTLIDTVSYEGNTGTPYTEGSGVGLEDNPAVAFAGISRFPDGVDTNQNNVDFSLRCITPGAVNTASTANCEPDAAPAVGSTLPANGAVDVPVNADIFVTFSEPVDVSGNWFDITCTSSGSHPATVAGGPTSFTLDPATDFAGSESCTVTIFATGVTDQDTQDPPDNMAADFSWSFSTTAVNVCDLSFTPAYAIQGSGSAAAITGAVTTQGVVVGDYEGPSPALRGFYLQDLTGDGMAATSDGIFVFNGNNDNVNLGDVVRVSGTAGEFQDQTQISSVTSIAPCGTGSVTPVDVTLPVPSATYLEQSEGMLVRFPQTLYVTEHFQLGRFGQVIMSSGDRLSQPTNVVAPGAPALAVQAANDLNRIIVDDALQNQNPDPILFGRGGNPLIAANTLRGGDTATGMVGVLSYTWAGNAASGNAYRLRPINALGGGVPNFVAANLRPEAPVSVGGTLRVSALNLLNYFNTFDGLPDVVDNCNSGVGGAATDCRGADTQAEFDRQWPKTVAAILAIEPDVLGVNEIENDGYGSTSAIQDLVDKLNAASAPGTYAFIDFDAATGQVNALGLDAIKVGLIYQPASVTPLGTTAVLNSVAFVNGGDTSPRNRVTFAQAFEQPNDARFIVSVNHLKSKGSPCDVPDALDGQGNCTIVRTNAANTLAAWLAGDPTGTGDSDILIIGDLNSYAKENPISALIDSGYTNLIDSFLGANAYSYVFDGQWGYLDYALASASLVGQVTGVAEYHINADEPSVLDYNTDFKSPGQIISLYSPDQFRVSDHDPVILGLDLNAPPDCSTASPSKSTLWPPKHKFKAINILGVTDPDGDAVAITIDSIFQDEPVNAPGDSDGNTSPDGRGVGTATAEVRAERDETLNGRVYHIGFTANDGHNNSCSGEILVRVPKSQGSGGAAVDEGALFDSTAVGP